LSFRRSEWLRDMAIVYPTMAARSQA